MGGAGGSKTRTFSRKLPEKRLNENLPIYDGNADLTLPRLQPLYPLLGTQHQHQANEQDSHHQNLLLKSTNVYIIYKLRAMDIIL